MHPLNRMLSLFGLRLSRISMSSPNEFKQQYKRNLYELKKESNEFKIFEEFRYDGGDHPISYMDVECIFAAQNIRKRNSTSILDVGSYRSFILGLLAHYKMMTLDVRGREPFLDNETILTCDAKQLDLPKDSFDTIVSLCALEHFGLGRYGDEFDLDADKKAFNEMVRVLKPGGVLIFTTTITRSGPSIVFNVHRIYNHQMIRALCDGLELNEEKFFSHRIGNFCSLEEVTDLPGGWDVYCGCWTKV